VDDVRQALDAAAIFGMALIIAGVAVINLFSTTYAPDGGARLRQIARNAGGAILAASRGGHRLGRGTNKNRPQGRTRNQDRGHRDETQGICIRRGAAGLPASVDLYAQTTWSTSGSRDPQGVLKQIAAGKKVIVPGTPSSGANWARPEHRQAERQDESLRHRHHTASTSTTGPPCRA